MRRVVVMAAVFALVGAFAIVGTSSAQVGGFGQGFNTVASLVPDIVGQPIENVNYDLIGNATQQTTNGMFVYHNLDNTVDFTNGSQTWVLTNSGLLLRNNAEMFGFEFVRQQQEANLVSQLLIPGMTLGEMESAIAQAQISTPALEAQLNQPFSLIP